MTMLSMFGTMHQMALPSFHGIFSSLGQEEQKAIVADDDFSVDQQELTEPEGGDTTSSQGTSAKGQMAVDIYEQDGYYIIRAPIAGVRLQDIDIEVEDRTVTITGHRRIQEDIDSDQFYLRECYFGEFKRSVTLPIEVDPKGIKATFSKDSVLKVIIPKPKEDKIKIVRVND